MYEFNQKVIFYFLVSLCDMLILVKGDKSCKSSNKKNAKGDNFVWIQPKSNILFFDIPQWYVNSCQGR